MDIAKEQKSSRFLKRFSSPALLLAFASAVSLPLAANTSPITLHNLDLQTPAANEVSPILVAALSKSQARRLVSNLRKSTKKLAKQSKKFKREIAKIRRWK